MLSNHWLINKIIEIQIYYVLLDVTFHASCAVFVSLAAGLSSLFLLCSVVSGLCLCGGPWCLFPVP